MAKYIPPQSLPQEIHTALEQFPHLQRVLLYRRGISDASTADAFLEPDYDRDTHDPFLLLDMNKAVMRIITALDQNETIAIYADFDADGIPGAVILHDFFTKIGYENIHVYIPHRHDEGYGVHIPAIDTLLEKGVTLMITVDVGITYADETAYAEKKGIDVIVTDHHEPQDIIPKTHAVINPKLNDYPDPMICGAAVAWKLMQAVLMTLQNNNDPRVKDIPVGWEKWLLDMVGIATISDMVPLVNENRALATYGLKVLRKNTRIGLKSLYQKNYVKHQNLHEDDIAFTITPRLNAASRMAHPRDAFELLIADSRMHADTAADHLTNLNNERKKLVARIVKAAYAKLDKRNLKDIIVVGDPDWNTGVSGLVAGKIADKYRLPTFVWSREGDAIKGSCRGNGDVSVVALMDHAESDTFIQFGGHEGAGGFSVDQKNIHHLEEKLQDAYAKLMSKNNGEVKETAPYIIDAELSLDDVTRNTYKTIQHLGPYGIGNPRPVFAFTDARVDAIRMFGKGSDHLEIMMTNESGKRVKAISFYSDINSFAHAPKEDEEVVVVAEIDYSTFMGKSELRLNIIDIFPRG